MKQNRGIERKTR